MSATFKLSGVTAMMGNIKRLRAQSKLKLKQAVARTVLEVVNRAKYYCPVDTSALRTSIQPIFPGQQLAFSTYSSNKFGKVDIGSKKVEFAGPKALDRVEGAVVVGMPYAMAVEMGTLKTPAQPFLRPALNDVAPAHAQRVKEAMGV